MDVIRPSAPATTGAQPAASPAQPLSARAEPPAVTVSKGGGAVRGIGEHFDTNPATGAAGLSVPLPLSPGRAGFTPELSLSYDSGRGQGRLRPRLDPVPAGGVPPHRQGRAPLRRERPVSALRRRGPGGGAGWRRRPGRTTADGRRPTYSVLRYRPRVEGLFARIERRTRSDGTSTGARSAGPTSAACTAWTRARASPIPRIRTASSGG